MATVNILNQLTDTQVIADVSDVLITTLATSPLTEWISFDSEARTGNEKGRFLWPERVLSETSSTLNANIALAATQITVVSTAAYRVGDQIHVEGHKDTNDQKVIYDVTGIASGTLLDVTLNTNGGADTALTAAGQVVHRASGIVDNFSDITSTLNGTDEPTIEYNVFQTFQEELELGDKVIELSNNGYMMGVEDLVAYGVEEKMFSMQYHIYNQVMRGVRRDESTTIGGAFGGIEDYVNNSGTDNRVNAEGVALTETMINDLLQKLIARGLPQATNMMLIMSLTNSRVLSAARNVVVAPNEFVQNTAIGGNVQTFYAELPGYGGMRILADPNLEDDVVYMISPEAVRFVTKANSLRPLSSIDMATLPGQYGKRWFIRSTLSMQIDAATRRHGVIHNIVPA